MKKYLILAALIPVLTFAQAPDNEKLITVVGFSELEIEPDIIVLGMSVKETENAKKESPTVTMEHNISIFLESIGVKKDQFQLDRYNANTQYSFSSSSKFKLNKSYKITIDKVNLLDTIMMKCLEYGMDNIYVQRIGHSKMDSIQNLLLLNAVKSSKEKAKIIAANMDLTLGKVRSVNETHQRIESRSDYYNNNDNTLQEEVVVGYGTQYKSRIGSSISVQKLVLSKTIIAKFEIQ